MVYNLSYFNLVVFIKVWDIGEKYFYSCTYKTVKYNINIKLVILEVT